MTLSTVPDWVVACMLVARVKRAKTDDARANLLAFLNIGKDKTQALNVHAMLHPKPAAILMMAAIKETVDSFVNAAQRKLPSCFTSTKSAVAGLRQHSLTPIYANLSQTALAVKEFKFLCRHHLELKSHTCVCNKPFKGGPRVYCPIACKIFRPS
jgi:hypothetical protein